jgi:hypothetical protein
VKSVDIVIPWQAGCAYRQLALDWVLHAHEALGRTVILGELEPGQPWCKATAVRSALDRSTADIVAISDGDVWTFQLDEGIEQLDQHPWSVPFREVHRLSPQATSTALQTGELTGTLQQRPYLGVVGGGLLVIEREAYEHVPLDHRFQGWGQEDEAWGAALAAVHGPGWRGTEPLYHLWHPPQQRLNRAVGSEESRHLRNLYLKARRSPAQMEALLTVARTPM